MTNDNSSCFSSTDFFNCCKIEALVSVDERGQLVLPKDIREKANLKAGDKLALISWSKGEEIILLAMIKSDLMMNLVKDLLGPMLSELNTSNLKGDSHDQ